VKGCDIAVADKELRMSGNLRVIQLVQHPDAAVTAPQAQYRVHFIVRKEPVDIRGPGGIRTGEKSVSRRAGGRQLHPVPLLLQKGHALFPLLLFHPGRRRQHPDAVSGFQGSAPQPAGVPLCCRRDWSNGKSDAENQCQQQKGYSLMPFLFHYYPLLWLCPVYNTGQLKF